MTGSVAGPGVAPTAPGTISVLIVDDHPVVRAGLAGVLSAEDGLVVLGEAGSGEEAILLTSRLDPDVVLMDLVMPGMSGIEATRRIAATTPRSRVLVLTTYDTAQDVVDVIEAGAAGYLLKDIPRRDLVAAIRDTAAGETVLAQPAARALIARTRAPEPKSVLTEREIDVLNLVARGMSNADIAGELFISEATVKTHLVRSFAKLGVDDRTAAVVAAIRQGLLGGTG